MNSIEELLKTHCPNGVEYKPLGELITRVTTKAKNVAYKVYSNSSMLFI